METETNIHAATLRPVPAFEDYFSKDIVDWVAPSPKTKYGNLYLLTNDVSPPIFLKRFHLGILKLRL